MSVVGGGLAGSVLTPRSAHADDTAYTSRPNVFTQNQYIRINTSAAVAPELHFEALNGNWVLGIDVVNDGGAKDFVIAGKRDYPNPGETADIVYIAHRGVNAPTVGIGVTPPDGSYRLQVSGQDSEPAMGGMSIRVGPLQAGKALAVRDSSGADRVWVDNDFWLTGFDPGLDVGIKIKAASSNQRALALARSDGKVLYGFEYDGNGLLFRYFTGSVSIVQFRTNGSTYWYKKLNVSDPEAGIMLQHIGESTPTGGSSGDIKIGDGKVWVNDRGMWKSAILV